MTVPGAPPCGLVFMRLIAKACCEPFFARSPYKRTSVSEPSAFSAAFWTSSGTGGAVGAAGAAALLLVGLAGSVDEEPQEATQRPAIAKTAKNPSLFMKSREGWMPLTALIPAKTILTCRTRSRKNSPGLVFFSLRGRNRMICVLHSERQDSQSANEQPEFLRGAPQNSLLLRTTTAGGLPAKHPRYGEPRQKGF